MKSKIFTLLAIFMLGLNANAKTLTISKTSYAPVIDGILESSIWDNAPAQAIDQARGIVDAAFTAEFKMLYDYNYVYIAVKVNDPDPYVEGASTWQSDCVELFFAIDTTGQPRSYANGQTNAFALRKISSKKQTEGGFEGAGALTTDVVKVAQNGDYTYIQEWAIPWAQLTEGYANWTGNEGSTFMLDVHVAQAKIPEIGREYQLFWNSSADNQYNTVQNQGYIVIESNIGTKALTINKINIKPVIDGTLESNIWDSHASYTLYQSVGDSPNIFEAEFKMCYDDKNLYVGVTVADSTPNIIGTSSSQSDGVEMFFAMNTENSEFYRAGDWQIRKISAKTQEEGGLEGTINLTDLAKSKIKVIQKDAAKYVQEWAIPWVILLDNSTSNFNGKQFRFDILAFDAADGKMRKLYWSSTADDKLTRIYNQGHVNLNTPINAIDISIASLQDDISAMGNTMRILTNELDNTKKEIVTLNSDVNTLKGQILNLNDSIVKKNNAIDSINYTLKIHSNEIANTKKDVDSLYKEVALLKNQIIDFNDIIASKNTLIAALNDSLAHGKYTAYDTVKVAIFDTSIIEVNVLEMDVVTKTLTLDGTKVEISVFPNPADELVNFKSSIEISRYEVYNLSNVLISQDNVNNTEFQLNISAFASGEYIIRLFSVKGNIMSKVLIKR